MAHWDEKDPDGSGQELEPSGPSQAEQDADKAIAERMLQWRGTDPDETALGLLEAHLRAVGEFNEEGSVWAKSLAGSTDPNPEDYALGTDDRDESTNPPEKPSPRPPGDPTPRVVTGYAGTVLPTGGALDPPEYTGPRGEVDGPSRRGQHRVRPPWWRFWR